MDDARRFRDGIAMNQSQQKMQNKNRQMGARSREINARGQVGRQARANNAIEFPARYTAKKGTAQRARQKRKNKKLNLKLASLLLAASIGIGSVTLAGKPHNNINITDLQQMGISNSELDLNEDTIAMMQKYDAYFENFEQENANLTESEVMSIINEIRELNFNVLKDKMAKLTGVTRSNVTLHYDFIRGEDRDWTSVKVDKNGREESYDNNYGILGIGNEHNIPKDVSYLITQIRSYDTLAEDLQADKITKVNAIKKLKKLYAEITEIATKDFSMDEKGNVKLQDYEEAEKLQDKGKEENER